MLNEFYAVTETSIYHVQAKGPYLASAVKIVIRGKSKIPLNDDLCKSAMMIAICKVLQAFTPEKYGALTPKSGYQSEISKVSTCYWGPHSSRIIALFKNKEDALACFYVTNPKPCDHRWIASTKTVLNEIGNNHPSFHISHFHDIELMSAKEQSA